MAAHLLSQVEPNAGNWKTGSFHPEKDDRLPLLLLYKNEIAEVLSMSKKFRCGR
jgi:hypothetical protein